MIKFRGLRKQTSDYNFNHDFQLFTFKFSTKLKETQYKLIITFY